jgi:hypothetical protein
MSSYTSIFPDKLSRLIGTGSAPTLVDVRTDEDFDCNPTLIPRARRLPYAGVNVGDCLMFDALRHGDAVRVTVRTVGGVKQTMGVIRE